MTPIGRNGEPTYKRIQNVIRRRIEGGQLKPGDMVASERELAKTHKVSLMTARHALADLAREGMVERRHGSGTFVAPPKIHFNKLMSYTEQMASRGLAVRSRIASSGVLENEPEIAAGFRCPRRAIYSCWNACGRLRMSRLLWRHAICRWMNFRRLLVGLWSAGRFL